MRNENPSTRDKHATRTALPSEVDPLSTTMRDLRAAMPRPRSDARSPRPLSLDETADTTPFALIDPMNPSATVRDLPAATGRSCHRRVQIAFVASIVLALAGAITAAV